MGQLTDICIGIQLGGSSGSDTKDSFISNDQVNENYKKVLDGKNINRYQKEWSGGYVRYGDWLHRKRDKKYFLNPKIVIRQIGMSPIATYDEDNFYTLNTIYNIINSSKYSLKYLIGIINSELGKWFWIKKNSDFKTLFPKIKKSQIEAVPIPTIDFDNKKEKAMHDQIVSLVDKMLDLNEKLKKAKTPHDRELIERRIKTTDSQIDQLVYELYGLTEDEIRVVEGE